MLLVVVAMLSMFAIMALAVDVITLYSARSEAQRAADAGALGAAKMLVDMGVTTDPTATVPTAGQIDAATKAAQSVAVHSIIAGRQVQTGDVTLTFPGNGTPTFNVNPKVIVTVQNTNLPTFFRAFGAARHSQYARRLRRRGLIHRTLAVLQAARPFPSLPRV